MRPSWLVAALFVSCSQGSPAPPALTVAAGSPVADPPPVSMQLEPVNCSLATGYRGSVSGLPVFARLASEGARLHGRYFYERTGSDISLEGSLSDQGDLHLVEGDAAA